MSRHHPEIECRPLEAWIGDYRSERIPDPWGASFFPTRQKLETEVGHLGGDRVIIEVVGARIRNDGWPYATHSPEPPVAVSFNGDQGWLRYQSDRYDSWIGNIHAIALTLERLRLIDRYGCVQRGEQYRGFAALPAGGQSGINDPVRVVADLLDVTVPQLEADAKRYIREARKMTHPDNPRGDSELFRAVQDAAKILGVA